MSQLDRRTLLKAGGAVAAVALNSCSDTKTATAAAPNWNSFSRSLTGRLRRPLGVIQWYSGMAAHPSSAQVRVAQTFITNGHRAVRTYSAGGYVNYVETGRSVSTYYGTSLPRLRAVKKKYDPVTSSTLPTPFSS
ncbi:berberine-like enzyme [Kribbella steppae]|uniref:Berberine-like enzyme n=1 Tax=Kribbella steppae TaxID=2512223 RepID=A0A4R2HNT9_9ACTN|nr:BBE domain-containing protein [Kribbella steppae]TCO32629.1 berberine-like enzyme [Kribbella steppae]